MGLAHALVSAEDARDQRVLGRTAVSALAIAVFSRDAISKVQPRFGASAMRSRRFLSPRTTARFAKSRYAPANRRYSNSKLISVTQSAFEDWKIAS